MKEPPNPDSPQAKAAELALKQLRQRLLDLSSRNRLLNFKHNARSGGGIRIVDASISELFESLIGDKPVELIAMPEPPDELDDEKTERFLVALEEAMLTDKTYIKELKEIEATGPDDSEARLRAVERTLRDKVRRKLKMPSRKDAGLSLKEWAVKRGINTDFDLATGGKASLDRKQNYWQTLLPQSDLDRRLRAIYQAANEAQREYGVQTLSCVFGFLEWSPKSVNDKAEDVLFSPLVLAPVEIKLKKQLSNRARGRTLIDDGDGESSRPAREGYLLDAEDAGEAQSNLTLRERLRLDYGIVLPEFDAEDDTLETYFAKVEREINPFKTWRLRRFVTLTHLTFSRLPMWLDLDPEDPTKTPPHLNPILLELLGGSDSSMEDETGGYTQMNDQKDLPLVLDCDSSQLEAISKAIAGRNLVIQGPPGTGKSQTIANLIACAMHAGKTVLFVAEKQVALEVVSKRLGDPKVGLEDFVLQLHSAKAGKKTVLEALKKRLSINGNGGGEDLRESAREHHKDFEEILNAYAKAINSRYGGLGWTIHDIIWRDLENFEKTVPSSLKVFVFKDVKNWKDEEWRNRREAFVSHLQLSFADGPSNNLSDFIGRWLWVQDEDIDVIQQRQISNLVSELVVKLDELEKLAICEGFHTKKSNLFDAQNLSDFFRKPPQRPEVRHGLWTFANKSGSSLLIQNFEKAIQEKKDGEDYLAATAPGAFAGLESVSETLSKLAEDLSGVASCGEFIDVDSLESARRSMDSVRANLETSLDDLVKLEAHFEKNIFMSSCEGPSCAAAAIEIAANFPKSLIGIVCELNKEGAAQTLREAARIGRDLSSLRSSIQDCCKIPLQNVLAYSVANALKKFREVWLPPLGWLLDPEYRKSCNLKEWMFEPCSIDRAIELFDKILDFKNRETEFQAHPALQMTSGVFADLGRDFTELEVLADWVDEVKAQLPLMLGPSFIVRRKLFEVSPDLHEIAGHLVGKSWPAIMRQIGEAASVTRQNPQEIGPILDKQLALLNSILENCTKLGISRSIHLSVRARIQESAEKIQSTLLFFDAHSSEAALLLNDFDKAKIEYESVNFFLEAISKSPLPLKIIKSIINENGDESWFSLHEKGAAFLAVHDSIDSKFNELQKLVQLQAKDFEQWQGVTINYLIEAFKSAIFNQEHLRTRCDFLASSAEIRRLGLQDFVSRVTCIPDDYSNPGAFFDRIAIRSLCELAFEETSELDDFRHKSPSDIRNRFREYDDALKSLDRSVIKRRLLERKIPAGVSVGRPRDKTQLGLIRHLIAQTRPRTSTRDLIRRAGQALQALQPCFMMSPLSVAQLIEREALVFDLVIFDEASQVRPEDAMCSILRANQFVIVGDQMQLPPTSFGNKNIGGTVTDDEEDSELDDDGFDESILVTAEKTYGCDTMLLWHYRSRDPSLIAFSNQEFYNQRLQIFPAPYEKNQSSGVHYIGIPGIYVSRTNLLEAQKCAEEVVQYMRRFPERSIGVVALNLPHAALITNQIDRLKLENSLIGEYIDRWKDTLEPFFVKNLETVQGDERDVIFISTVFGHDQNGNFYQRYGPINSSVGHRRLNVLFTRAKHQIIVVSSIPIEKIRSAETEESVHWGVRALKKYLEFAKFGLLETGLASGRSFDSPFERAVSDALQSLGYACSPQVGINGFFIDLGVRHPRHPNYFILGIECDGATYHSSASARDRDRLRQEILENLGWSIHRVWSTDWFRNRDRELQKLVSRIKAELEKGVGPSFPFQ